MQMVRTRHLRLPGGLWTLESELGGCEPTHHDMGHRHPNRSCIHIFLTSIVTQKVIMENEISFVLIRAAKMERMAAVENSCCCVISGAGHSAVCYPNS